MDSLYNVFSSSYRACRDKEEEGSLENITAVNSPAVQYGNTQRNEDTGSQEVYHTLMEQESMAPSKIDKDNNIYFYTLIETSQFIYMRFKHHAFYICTELCIFDVIYYLVFFMSLIGLIYFHGMPDNIIFYRVPC